MAPTLRAALAALVLGFAAPVAASADDADAIQAVIADQLSHFAEDDWSGAFEHASPALRRIFRTPENFGRMVREGYPMVWRPSRIEVGPLERRPDGPVQIMYYEDASGVLYVAAYEMEEFGGGWRIAGVRIERAPDAAV